MDYVPVRLGTLRTEEPTRFDVFLLLTNHYIHYFRDSDPIEESRIVNLKKKGVKKLYIRKEDEPKYLEYLGQGLKSLANTNISVETRSERAHAAIEISAEKMNDWVQSEAAYNSQIDQFDKLVNFFSNESSAVKSIMNTAGVSQDLFQHSANVCTLALGIAKLMNISDKNELNNLGMAAILHDIGKTKMSFDPDKKEKMTVSELEEFQKHPSMAGELLNGKSYISAEILNLINDHEELGNGKGFPDKKNIVKLPLISQILNLANNFDNYCQEKQKQPLEAIEGFFTDRIGLFELDHMKLIKSVLKTI